MLVRKGGRGVWWEGRERVVGGEGGGGREGRGGGRREGEGAVCG